MKQEGCQVLKWVLSMQKCAEVQKRTNLPGGGGYQGTIRTPSSKVGEEGICKKGQEGRQGPATRLVDYTTKRPI